MDFVSLFYSWVGKIHWRRDRLPTPVFLGFPCGWAGKESPCNAGDLDSIPGLGRCPGEGKGYPLQYSGLENLNMTEWLSLSICFMKKERCPQAMVGNQIYSLVCISDKDTEMKIFMLNCDDFIFWQFIIHV